MNIRYAIRRTAAMACLPAFLLHCANLAHLATDAGTRKRVLTIPIALAAPSAKPAPALECEVAVGPESPISALAFSSDGKTLVTGGYREVLIWDLANAKLLKRIGVGKISDSVHALAFLKGDRLLAVGEGTPRGSGAVRIFDVETGRETQRFTEPQDVVYALALSPDGNLLAAGGADKRVYIWNLAKSSTPAVMKEHGDCVWSAAFSPDGKLLATGSADKTLRVWEFATTKPVVRMQQSDSVQSVDFGPGGRLLAIAIGGENENAVRFQAVDNTPQTGTQPSKAQAAKTQPAKTQSATKQQTTKQQAKNVVFRPNFGQIPRQNVVIYTGSGKPLDMIWDHNSDRMYVSCSDKTVKVFDAANGQTVYTLSGHMDWVYGLALSRDGTRLASGSGDGTVKLWNTANGKLLATLLQLTPRTDEWLIVSAQGYLAASSTKAFRWKTANLAAQSAELTKLLQNADSIQKALAGAEMVPPALR